MKITPRVAGRQVGSRIGESCEKSEPAREGSQPVSVSLSANAWWLLEIRL